MRYIDISKIELPEGWKDKADSLAKQLREAGSEESRNAIISKNQI